VRAGSIKSLLNEREGGNRKDFQLERRPCFHSNKGVAAAVGEVSTTLFVGCGLVIAEGATIHYWWLRKDKKFSCR